ncbi:transposase [Bacillus sp. F19]|nr:transposase [Bacillus sp. F19]
MAEFSKEEKIMAVKRYLAGEDSFKGIANSIGADTGDLRTWLKRFEYYGEEAFEKAYTIYSASDKLNVLNYMHEHRKSTRVTAAVFRHQGSKYNS